MGGIAAAWERWSRLGRSELIHAVCQVGLTYIIQQNNIEALISIAGTHLVYYFQLSCR